MYIWYNRIDLDWSWYVSLSAVDLADIWPALISTPQARINLTD